MWRRADAERSTAEAVLRRVERALLPPVARRLSAEEQGRALALAAASLSVIAACLMLAPVAVLGGDKGLLGVVCVAASWFLGALAHLRVVRDVKVASVAVLAGATAAFLSAMTVTGGLGSPMVPWIPVFPLVLAVSGGPELGAVGLVIAALASAAWLVAGQRGLLIDPHRESAMYTTLIAIHATLAMTVSQIVVTGYGYAFRRLGAERLAAERARAASESALLSRAQHLAAVAHDVRNPLAGMLGIVEILDGTPLQPAQREWMSILGSTSRAVLDLMNDLIDLGRLESGNMPVFERPLNLHTLVRHAVAVFRPVCDLRGVRIDVVIDPRVPEWVRGDATRLRQALTNLVGNAAKFTSEGEVVCRVDVVGEQLVIRVSDTGPGVAPERFDAIFEPFVQAEPFRDAKRGAGLGLAISRMLIERMGGTIGVKSAVDHGAEFVIRLPLLECTGDDSDRTSPTLDLPARSLRVLVADDSAVNRRVVGTMLTTLGHEVGYACDGEEVVSESCARPYDVVLMDVHMPNLDGLGATSRLRADPRFRRVTILGLTASADASLHQACAEAGMNGVLTKPVGSHALGMALRGLTRLTPLQPEATFPDPDSTAQDDRP